LNKAVEHVLRFERIIVYLLSNCCNWK